jgi:hypothetical protein
MKEPAVQVLAKKLEESINSLSAHSWKLDE